MGRRLLVVNQYYAPDVAASGQIAADLCEGLVKRGFEVHVVAGQPSYGGDVKEQPAEEVLNGVHVYRVAMRTRGRASMRSRIVGYWRFLRGGASAARKIARSIRPDVVVTLSNPPLVGRIGARVARDLTIPFVYLLHDIHPDALVASGWLRVPKFLIELWDRAHRRVLGRATKVVVLGEGMKETLVTKKGVDPSRVEVIPLWGRPEIGSGDGAHDARTRLAISESELVILHAGNMGIMHPIDPILDAAKSLRGREVRFVFLGDGPRRVHVAERVQAEGISNVLLLGYLSQNEFLDWVRASDACLVGLEPGMEGLAVPSRAFTFLSAGKPLIATMSPTADVARIAVEGRCGWVAGDAEAVRKVIEHAIESRTELQEMSANAARVYRTSFARESVLDQYAGLFNSLR